MTEDRNYTSRAEHDDLHQPAMSRRRFLAATAAGSAAFLPGGLSSLFRPATAVAGSTGRAAALAGPPGRPSIEPASTLDR